MKRIFVRASAAAAVLAVVVTTALAAGPGVGRYALDMDGDGLCDYAGQFCRYTDGDGDGLCDYAGQHCHYTDADGDGLCDACGGICQAEGAGFSGGRRGGAGSAAGWRGRGCRGGFCG